MNINDMRNPNNTSDIQNNTLSDMDQNQSASLMNLGMKLEEKYRTIRAQPHKIPCQCYQSHMKYRLFQAFKIRF